MKLYIRIISFFMLLMTIMNVTSICGYTVAAADYSNMVQQAESFINHGATQAGNSGISVGDITSEFTELGKILTTIGAGVMVAVTTYMGIKYITAGPEAQAKLKQQLIGVVVSGIVIFGAYGIWQIVGQIAQSFEK